MTSASTRRAQRHHTDTSSFPLGIINSFWWIDPERGVAGFLAGQQLPFASPEIMGAWVNCEKAVYDGLDEVEAGRAKVGK